MAQENGGINPITGLPYGSAKPLYDALRNIPTQRRLTGDVGSVYRYEGMDDSFESYLKYGVTPVPGYDMDEARAQAQPFTEKLGRGMLKLAGKTGTALSGATIGTLYGVGSMISNKEFSAFYDNEFQRTLDDWNERMDKNLAHYYTKKEQEAGFFQSLGSANFWLNDVSNAMSFTIGAVLSELVLTAATIGSGGTGAALQAAQTANILSKAKSLVKGVNKAKNIKRATSAATVGRQIVTGAGYESAVEARHFKDQAIEAFMAANPDATEEQLTAAHDFINMQANMVFAGNLALVGYSNAAQFKTIFGKGLKTQASANFAKGVNKESGDLLTGTFTAAGKGASKLEKGLDIGYRVVKNPIYEGVIEEGGQSIISNTALNYLKKGYSVDGTSASYDLMSAFNDAFAETYGTKEGWKEIGIGMIVGAMGSPTFRAIPFIQKDGWAGGIADSLKERTGALAEQDDLAKRNTEWTYNNLRNNIKLNNQIYTSNEELGDAIEAGDLFAAKNAEADATFAFMSTRNDAGLLGDTVDEFTAYVNELTLEDFKAEFGYNAESKEDLAARKSQVIESFKNKAKDVQSSMADASVFSPSEDYSDDEAQNWRTGLGHLIYRIKDADKREAQLFTELQAEIPNLDITKFKSFLNLKASEAAQRGSVTRAERELAKTIPEFQEALSEAAANLNTPTPAIEKLQKELDKLTKYRTSIKPGEQEKIKELNTRIQELKDKQLEEYNKVLEKASKNRFSKSEKVAKAKEKLDALQKRQHAEAQAEKDELTRLTSTLQDSYENYNTVAEAINSYREEAEKVKDATTPTNRTKLARLTSDINALMEQRKELIKNYNALFTKEGQKEFADAHGSLIKLYDIGKSVATAEGAILRGRKAEKVTEEPIVSEQELNNIEDTEFKADWDRFKQQVVNANLSEEELLTNLEEWKKFFQDKARTYTGDKHDNYAKAVEHVTARIDDIKKSKSKEQNRKNNLASKPFKPVVHQYYHLNQIITLDASPEVQGFISNLTYEDVLKNGVLSVDDYEGDNYGNIYDHNDKVSTINGHTTLKDKAVHLWYQSDIPIDNTPSKTINGKTYYRIGYMPDPRRFVDKTGQRLVIDNSPAGKSNIHAINPAFVRNGALTEDGARFLGRYTSMVEFFENNLSKENDSIPLKDTTFVSIRQSIKYIFDNKPAIDDFFKTNDYDVEVPGVGTGLLLVERDSSDPSNHVAGNNIWIRENGEWRKLDGNQLVLAKDYANGLKTKDGKNKFHIPQAGQYSLIASIGKVINVLDTGKPSIKEIADKEATWKAIKEQLDEVQETEGTASTGVDLKDNSGRPLFVSMKSSKFLEDSAPSIRVKLKIHKWDEKGAKVVIYFTHDGVSHKATVMLQSSDKINSYDDFVNQITRIIKYGDNIKELKQKFPDLEFANLQSVYDEVATDVGKLHMNAIPNTEIEINVRDLADTMKKISGVVPNVEKETVEKKEPKKQSEIANLSLSALREVKWYREQFVPAIESIDDRQDMIDTLEKYKDKLIRLEELAETIPAAQELKERLRVKIESLNTVSPTVAETAPTTEDKKVDTEQTSEKPIKSGPIVRTDPEAEALLKELLDDEDTPNLKFIKEGEAFDDPITSFDEKVAIIKRIVPDWVSIQDIERLVVTLSESGITLGAYMDNVIYLSNKSGNKTAYHEAFHLIFRTAFNRNQLRDYIEKSKMRYSKPTKSDIDSIINLASANGKVLSVGQATDIYYEEKMADEFMEFAYSRDKKVTGWFKSLIDRIKRWLKSLIGSKNDLNSLFTDIYSGKFVGVSKPVNPIYKNYPPALLTLETKTVDGARIIESSFNILSKDETNRIIYSILNNLIQSPNPSLESNIIAEINNQRNNYYNPAVWKEELRAYKNKHGATAMIEKFNRIKVIHDLLANPKNVNAIVKDIQTHLRNIDISIDESHNLDLIEQDYEANTESDFGRFDQALFEIGGISSLSKAMKEYIFTTTDAIDEFGFGFSPSEMEGITKFDRSVNGNVIYTGLQRLLSSTDPEKMFNKFYNYQRNNIATKAFFNKLVRDVANQTGKTEDDIISMFSKESLTGSELYDLRESHVVNMFISTFSKDVVPAYTLLFDKESGKIKVFAANTVGSDKIQIESWRGNFEAIAPNNMPDIMDRLFRLYVSPNVVAEKADNAIDIMSIDEHAERIANLMSEVGIELSPAYVKWSLLDYHKEQWQEFKNEEFENFYNSFRKVTPLHNSLDVNFNTFALLRKFAKENPITDDNPSGFYSMIDTKKGLGILKKIAKSNATFDENVGDSTYRNAEGKQVFAYLSPSYITTLFRRIADSNVTLNDLQPLFDGLRITDDYRKEMLRQVLSHNNLLKGLISRKPGKSLIIENNPEYAEFVIQNLSLIIADGIREESFGEQDNIEDWKRSEGASTYSNLGAESQELFKLSLFADSGLENNAVKFGDTVVDMRYFLINNSEKSTQLMVRMPVNNNVINSDMTLTEYSKTAFYNLFAQEYERIQKIVQEIEQIKNETKTDFISTAYHGNSTLHHDMVIENGVVKNASEIAEGLISGKYRARGLSFYRYVNHPMAREMMIAALSGQPISQNRESIKESMNDYYMPQVMQYIDTVLVPFGVVIKEDNVYTNNLLPKQYGEKILNVNQIANFFINHTINVASVNQLVHGDLALSYKDLKDFTKRNGGLIAAGPSSSGTVRYKVKPTVKTTIEPLELIRHEVSHNDSIDRTDAQNFGSVKFYINHYLKPLGKYPTVVKDILKKIERGTELVEPLTREELDILDRYNANFHDRKIVGRDISWYDKTSLHTLTRGQTSLINPKFRAEYEGDKAGQIEEMNRRYDALENANTESERKEAAASVNEMFVSRVGRLERHLAVNDMNYNNYDLIIYDSASKMTNFDVGTDRIHEVDGEWIREQVNTDGFKNNIIHGTQLMQLIWSEQNPDTEVEWGGSKIKIGELVTLYNKLLSKRVDDAGVDFSGTIFEIAPDGRLTIDAYRKLHQSLKNGLITDDLWVTELFSLDSTGSPKYDLNYPAIKYKYESMFLAYVSNEVFKQKVPGRKYTLVSDEGIEVAREIVQTVSQSEAEQLVKDGANNIVSKDDKFYKVGKVVRTVSGKKTITTRLRHAIKDKDRFGNEIYVSEAIVSEKAARAYGLKIGDEIPPEIAIQMGIRIPTQDKHSMVNLKIVDLLPDYYGNSIMVPYEIIALSGADFDIDSLFARMYSTYKTSDGRHIAYGNYLNHSNPERAAWREYITSMREFDLSFEDFLNVEFDGKLMKSIIASNVKNFKEGKPVDPITVEELNNMILDVELRLTLNDGNKKQAGTPASMEVLKKIRDEFISRDIVSKDDTSGIDTPLDQYKTAKSLEIGDKGIGVSAVFNTMFQRLQSASSDFAGYEVMFNGVAVRKNDVFSAIISAMTDNAKERLATEFNLTLDTLGPAMYMIGRGVPVDSVLYMMRQPIISEYVKATNIENSPIEINAERIEYDAPALRPSDRRSIMSALMSLGINDVSGGAEVTDKETMSEMIRNYEEGTSLTEQQLKHQKYVLKQFIDAKVFSEDLRAYRAVSSLLKGFDSSWYRVEDLFKQLDKLGIEYIQKENTSGLNADDWYLSQKEDDDGVPSNNSKIDYVKMMKESVDYTNVKMALATIEGSKLYFITQSDVARVIKDTVMTNFRDDYWLYPDNHKHFEDSLIAYLISKAFRNKFGSEYTVNDLISELPNDLYNNVSMLKDKYPDNYFLKLIRFKPFTYKKGIYAGKTLNKLAIETNFNNDVMRQEELIRGFNQLNAQVQTNKFENPGVVSLEEKTMKQLISYLVAKDGMLFKNGSFIRAISPLLIQDAFTGLADIRALFSGATSVDYETVFGKGMTLAKITKEFSELYARSSDLTYYLNFSPTVKIGDKIISGLDEKGNLVINLYAGGRSKNKEANAEQISKNAKTLDKMNIKPVKISGGTQRAFPLVMSFNKKPYKLEYITTYLKSKDISITFTPSGRIINGTNIPENAGSLNYLVEVGVISKGEADAMLFYNVGRKATYSPTDKLGNQEINHFGSTIKENNSSVSKPVGTKKTTSSLLDLMKNKTEQPVGSWNNLKEQLYNIKKGDTLSFDSSEHGPISYTFEKDMSRVTMIPSKLIGDMWGSRLFTDQSGNKVKSAEIGEIIKHIEADGKYLGMSFEKFMEDSQLKIESGNKLNFRDGGCK